MGKRENLRKFQIQGPTVFKIRDHIILTLLGMNGDARMILRYARKEAYKYHDKFDEEIPVQYLYKRICEYNQGFTQRGGVRPLAVEVRL